MSIFVLVTIICLSVYLWITEYERKTVCKERDLEFDIEEMAEVESIKKPFRPETFKEYYGQRNAKSVLNDYIVGCKNYDRIFPHTLISGLAGQGKTTLAYIIANKLGVEFKEAIASNIEISEILPIIKNLNGGILFLDEVHSIERREAEKLYSLMEDFSIGGVPVQPFTLIGATTELGEIIKNRKPFCDRFKLQIVLDEYDDTTIVKILEQYSIRVFGEVLSKADLFTIAKNCKKSPREGQRLLEHLIYCRDISRVLEKNNIIKDGITIRDLKFLSYLLENGKGVGIQAISSYMNIPQDTYMYEIEPYLIQLGLVLRTPRGRKISEKGIEFLSNIKPIIKI